MADMLSDFAEHDEYAEDEQAEGQQIEEQGDGRKDFVSHDSHVIPKSGLDCQALIFISGHRMA